jgi:hypothetical protein
VNGAHTQLTSATAAESFSERPFLAEALVSAGARRSAQEEKDSPELCEDCAGICFGHDQVVFWLADGASDCNALPRLQRRAGEEIPPPSAGFNVRLLANDLGQAFVEHLFLGTPWIAEGAEHDVIHAAFSTVAARWQERFARYVSVIEARGLLETLTEEILPKSGDGTNRVDWSATFTGGVFNTREQTLWIVNYGYSGGIVMTAPPAVITPNTNLVTLWASIAPEEGRLRPAVTLSVDNPEGLRRFTNVEGFALISDGLERTGIRNRLQTLATSRFEHFAQLRRELLEGSGLSRDDKSIVFGHFL